MHATATSVKTADGQHVSPIGAVAPSLPLTPSEECGGFAVAHEDAVKYWASAGYKN